MSNTYTCITCQVMFKTAELQREHYKLDWHRYNLKRKVASIPPVTLEEFEQRAKEHREQSENAERGESEYCRCCSKLFNTKNAYNNHLNSKKHKLAEEKNLGSDRPSLSKKDQPSQSDSDSFEKVEADKALQPGKFVVVNAEDSADDDIETDSEIEEVRLFFIYPYSYLISFDQSNLDCPFDINYIKITYSLPLVTCVKKQQSFLFTVIHR